MVRGHTRREFLSSVTKAGAAVGAVGTATAGYRLSRLSFDPRNLRMPASVAARLSRSTLTDWRYCWASAAAVLPRFGLVAPHEGEMQTVSAEAGFVSTPTDGLAAGVTETGRLSTLLAPHTGFTHQLPYYATDWRAPLLGAKPRAGGFAGLRIDGETTWLWTDAVDHTIGYLDDTGILELTYTVPADALGDDGTDSGEKAPTEGTVDVTEQLYVLPGTETLVREFDVDNRTDASLEGSVVYHTQANVSDNQQNFVVWESSPNRLTAGEALRWRDRAGPYELLVYTDATVAASGAARTGPDVAEADADLPEAPDDLGDLLEAVESALAPVREIGESSLPDVLASDADEATGRYLSGHLETDLALAPGESRQLAVFVACGPDPDRLAASLRNSRARRLRRAEGYWQGATDRLALSGIPARYRPAARRAVITVCTLVDGSSGSISASGNLQPSYYPTWPRDGAFAAAALARVGLAEHARTYLGEFLPAVQGADGSFRQCYDSRGEDAGLLAVENDQQPLFAWAVRDVYDTTGDDGFLVASWPAVRDALDYTVDAIAPNGLLVATPDIQEGPGAVRQSLWTNALAYEGLRSGAELAAAVEADPRPYREAAGTVGDALHERFFASSGFVTAADFWGHSRDLKGYVGAAVWPSRWAGAYGEVDRIATDLAEQYRTAGVEWIPGALLAVGALARAGETGSADAMLADVLDRTAPAGYLAEDVTADGRHQLASPLGWSSAGLLLALEQRYRPDQSRGAGPGPTVRTSPGSRL